MKESLLELRGRGVERGFASEELEDPFLVFVPFVAPPSAPLEQEVIPSLGTSPSNVEPGIICFVSQRGSSPPL